MTTPAHAAQEAVILLHGLGNPPWVMKRLAKAFSAAGYAVYNWDYASYDCGLLEQIERLKPRLAALPAYTKIHGVGHSMGGLLLRGIFADTTKPLGRLVTIGTPHLGAGVVHRLGCLRKMPLLNRAIITDLATHSAALAALPMPEIEMGCIIGVQSFHPLNPLAWLNQLYLGKTPHDGTVEASNAQHPAMKDSIEVKANHLLLPFKACVIAAALKFIQQGKF